MSDTTINVCGSILLKPVKMDFSGNTERTRVDKAHFWPQILRKVKSLYYINIFLTIERQPTSVQENMFEIIIMHLVLPW